VKIGPDGRFTVRRQVQTATEHRSDRSREERRGSVATAPSVASAAGAPSRPGSYLRSW
jgi:hypothetical protein